MTDLQPDQEAHAQRQVVQAGGRRAHPVLHLPHLVEGRQHQVHDAVHEGAVDRRQLHDGVGEEHDERQDEPLAHDGAGGLVRRVVRAPKEIRVVGVVVVVCLLLADLRDLASHDRRRVRLPEEEESSQLHRHVQDRRRPEDPPPAVGPLRDVGSGDGGHGRPDEGQHPVDGLPLASFFFAPDVGEDAVADL